MGSKLPFLGKLLTWMDDLFGYGLIDDGKKLDAWWDPESPTRGMNSPSTPFLVTGKGMQGEARQEELLFAFQDRPVSYRRTLCQPRPFSLVCKICIIQFQFEISA